jgi:hypothetical protein
MLQATYDKLLKQLKKVNPAHDLIPVIESMPGTHLAIEYIKLAIAEVPTVSAEEYTIQVMQKQRGTLYSRRAVLSNKFHIATTTQERAEVSIAIGSLQTEIIDNRRKLEYYNETGKLPAIPDKLVLPASGERKRMKLHSVRTSISRYRGLIRKETDPAKIKDYEHKLAILIDQSAELSA